MNDIPIEFKNKIAPCRCPHCKNTKFIRYGKDGKTQKFCCKQCGKIFRATTGTPMHGMHKKERIRKYLLALYYGYSVRKAARTTGISVATSFNWRHKFLTSLSAAIVGDNVTETSTVSLVKMHYSAKGRRKKPEKHQESSRNIQIVKAGQVRLQQLPNVNATKTASSLLNELISSELCVIVPNRMLTVAFHKCPDVIKLCNSEQNNIYKVKSRQKTAELLHWMERFRGVASKYLQQYWNWYSALNNIKVLKEEVLLFFETCITQRNISIYKSLKSI